MMQKGNNQAKDSGASLELCLIEQEIFGAIVNIYISSGYVMSILANSIKAIGTQLRADEEQRVTIL